MHGRSTRSLKSQKHIYRPLFDHEAVETTIHLHDREKHMLSASQVAMQLSHILYRQKRE